MSGRLPPVTLTWLLSAAAVSLSSSATKALAFDLPLVRQGEVWRILTGHLVHSSSVLAAVDLGAFLVLGWLLEARRPRIVAPVLLAAALVASLTVLLLRPDLRRYEGSSALSCGLFAALACLLMREGGAVSRILSGAALLAFLVKAALESAGMTTWTLVPEAEVVVPAHLGGAAAGWIVARLSPRNPRRSEELDAEPLDVDEDRIRRHIAVEPMFGALIDRGEQEAREKDDSG